MEDFQMAILFVVAVALMLAGFLGYNSIRRKWAGIIGIGGAYIITLGILMGVSLIGAIIGTIFGASTEGSSIGEVILIIIFTVLCLGYMVYVMLTRCQTVAQRVLLPFVALLIGFGFCWRLLAAIFLHMPMESQSADTIKFPSMTYDPNGEQYRLQSDSGDHADYYCERTGQTVQFHKADFEDGPYGWRKG